MPVLRVNNVGDSTGNTNPITLSSSTATTATWSSAPTNMPTVASPNILKISVEPNTANEEIIYVTAFTSGDTSATVDRGQEGSTAIAHAATAWVHAPTADDANQGDTTEYSTAIGPLALAGAEGAIAVGVDSTGTPASTSTQDQAVIGTSLTQTKLANLATSLVTVTSNYAMTRANGVILANGAITVTLPDPSLAGTGHYRVINVTTSDSVTVDPYDSETIDGASALSLTPLTGADLVCDGTNWHVGGRNATQIQGKQVSTTAPATNQAFVYSSSGLWVPSSVVNSLAEGSGISLSAATGAVTVGNTGVLEITSYGNQAGLSWSAGTGAISAFVAMPNGKAGLNSSGTLGAGSTTNLSSYFDEAWANAGVTYSTTYGWYAPGSGIYQFTGEIAFSGALDPAPQLSVIDFTSSTVQGRGSAGIVSYGGTTITVCTVNVLVYVTSDNDPQYLQVYCPSSSEIVYDGSVAWFDIAMVYGST